MYRSLVRLTLGLICLGDPMKSSPSLLSPRWVLVERAGADPSTIPRERTVQWSSDPVSITLATVRDDNDDGR